MIILTMLMLASLGWSVFVLWIEIAGQSPQADRTLFGTIFSLGVMGWGTITFYLWAAHRRGTLGRQLKKLRFLTQKRALIWASVAALWVVLRVLGRLLVFAFDEMLLPPLYGMVLFAVLGSILLLGLRIPGQQDEALPSTVVVRLAGILIKLLPGVALLAIAIYLIVAILRLPYPFGMEWMEGGSVEQIRRLLAGQPLYVRPSMDFIPYIYTPVYFYVSALVAQVTGVGFVPLRLVSIVASAGCLLIIFRIVERETSSRVDAILAAGLFAATYQASASWIDLARVDALALCFLLAAVYALRFQPGTAGAAMAGGLLALSFMTKQTVLIAALPIMLYSLADDWRRGVCFNGTGIVIVMLSCLALNVASDGWFAYYIFQLPGQHRLYLPMLYGFWAADVWLPVGIACTLAIAYLVSMLPSLSWLKQHVFHDALPIEAEVEKRLKTGLFYLAMLAGMVGGSWAGKLNDGGFNNVLLLVYAALAILFGLAVHHTREWVKTLPVDQQSAAMVALYTLCLIQFVGLAYNPLACIPTREDYEAGRLLVETISNIDGDVFAPFHGYLAVKAGKPSYANGVALGELAGDFGGQELDSGSAVLDEIELAVREQRFGAIILDSLPALDRTRLYQRLQPLLDQYYRQGPPLLEVEAAFWPLTGTRSRPDVIYYPMQNE
ncbi:MAG: glycosyltransferase family 39 protein [Anaerolineae bacterium]|nr:glycosyltransferase family 39 protein [Anaerolineae bacterium]